MLTEKQLRAAPAKNYMNEDQLEFFKHKLLGMKEEVKQHLIDAKAQLSEREREFDELDRAQIEEDMRLQLRIIERESKLLPKIDEAIERISEGVYGYCEATGEPIGIERLLIRPTATFSAEEKSRQEEIERVYRDA